jgi:hypothetical protein
MATGTACKTSVPSKTVIQIIKFILLILFIRVNLVQCYKSLKILIYFINHTAFDF